MISLASVRDGGTTYVPGVLGQMVTGSAGERGGEGKDYVRECLNYMKLGYGDEKVEFLWLRDRRKANEADIMVVVSYRQPKVDEKVDEIFYKQLEVLRSLVLFLMGDFKFPDVCWKYSTTEKTV